MYINVYKCVQGISRVVVVFVMLRAVTSCLESYTARVTVIYFREIFLGDLLTTVRLCQWCAKLESVASLSELIKDNYRISFKSRSLIRILKLFVG